MKHPKSGRLLSWELGSFAVKDATQTRDDGGEYRVLRILWRDKPITSLDAYEVTNLRDALTEWLTGP